MKNFLFVLTLLAVLGFYAFTNKKPVTWTAIGDSITYLNDHQNETGYRLTEGYLTQTVEQLPYLHYINQGHNGWTAVGIAREIEKLGIQKSDLYTIFLGTNDWWGGVKLGTIADYENNTGTGTTCGSFRVIVDKLRSLNPSAKIIFITPMQRGDFVYINDVKNNAWGSYKEKNGQKLEDFANAVKMIGQKENFAVVDLYHKNLLNVKHAVHFKRLKNAATGKYQRYKYPAYINVNYNPETDNYPYPVEAIDITYDGLHPSDKGCKIISTMLVDAIKQQHLDE